MKILINHLTRMQPGYICVAGIDLETGAHIRPVLGNARLTTGLLSRNGGPFELGCVVDLGPTVHVGRAPEHEDHRFDPAKAACLGCVPDDYFWDTLRDSASDALQGIFGKDLAKHEKSCVMDVGKGKASLGCLAPRGRPSLYVNRHGSVRISFPWLSPSADLSVTDLRFCEEDHKTPRKSLISHFQKELKAGTGVILSVGLTRPWRKEGDAVARHWLQVNNIHLEDDPLLDSATTSLPDTG
ncbi:MAG: dual OB domain-containing protein [Rubrobacteraceae bacterium]